MARKMLFIFFTMLPSLENERKTIYLLSFCSISLYLTIKNNPYNRIKLNRIENCSNWASLITVFSGCLYVNGANHIIKAFGFGGILFINIRFISLWTLTFSRTVMRVYKDKIIRFCPLLFIFLTSLKKAFKKTKFNYDIKKSTRDLWAHYLLNYRSQKEKITKNKFSKKIHFFD